MRITEKQFFTYIECPVKYDLMFNKGIQCETVDMKDILQKCVNGFFLEMITKMKAPSLNTLTRKFDSSMKKYGDMFNDKKKVDSLFLLRNFYNWACDNRIVVVSLNEPYVITTDNNNVLEGICSPVAYNENGRYEVIKNNFSQRQYDDRIAPMLMKNSIDVMACSNNADEKISAVRINHVRTGKELKICPTLNDNNRLLKSIDGVCSSIENGIFYARDGFACEKCSYKNICRGWGI